MKKIICGTEYDTESAQEIKKYTVGAFGDPEGYEETLYRTQGGKYFLYTNGGEDSEYPKENIKRMSAAAADKWLIEH